MLYKSYTDYFPYSNMRGPQKKILQTLDRMEEINKDRPLDKKYRYLVIEAGTGVGKSAIAQSIASKYGSAYILTATKSLQDQYANDFPNYVKVVKGRGNYSCAEEKTCSCANGKCVQDKSLRKKCYVTKACPYTNAVNAARNSVSYVTSYAYFFSTISRELSSFNSQKIDTKRDVLIIDECHLLENQLLSMAEFKIDKAVLRKKFELDTLTEIFTEIGTMEPLNTFQYMAYWQHMNFKVDTKNNKSKDELLDNLKYIERLLKTRYLKWEEEIDTYKDSNLEDLTSKELSEKKDRIKKLPFRLQECGDYLNKIKYFIYDIQLGHQNNSNKTELQRYKDDWIIKSTSVRHAKSDYNVEVKKSENKSVQTNLFDTMSNDDFAQMVNDLHKNESNQNDEFTFDNDDEKYFYEDELSVQPLEVGQLFKQYLDKYARKYVVFMSATILDRQDFCMDIGLTKEKTALFHVDSTFDPERSPIVTDTIGNMSYNSLDDTLPGVVDEIKRIMAMYPGKRGLIHTGNYRIAKYISDNLRSSRLVSNLKNNLTNEELIIKHKNKKGSVLLSPAMTTGVSLEDDDCRFQIVIKMPFASLADPRIRAKNARRPKWYMANMIRSFVQACGRGTRSEKDWCATYVLDNYFNVLTSKYKDLLPQQFKNRIVHINCFDHKLFMKDMGDD